MSSRGKSAKLKIKRINIAERLYRITGEGIYRDSVLAGRAVPIRQPLLNGGVVGQDSVMASVYRGKIHWFWGDTSRQRYPLGHFQDGRRDFRDSGRRRASIRSVGVGSGLLRRQGRILQADGAAQGAGHGLDRRAVDREG